MKNFYVVGRHNGYYSILKKFPCRRLAKKMKLREQCGDYKHFVVFSIEKSRTRELLLNRLSGY